MKKYLLILGIGTVVLTYVFNLSYAVDNYGIVTNPLSLSVFAEGSSGEGSSGGEGGLDYYQKSTTAQTKTVISCNGAKHEKAVYNGNLTTCSGKGNVSCVEKWVSDGSLPTTTTSNCPGSSCEIQ